MGDKERERESLNVKILVKYLDVLLCNANKNISFFIFIQKTNKELLLLVHKTIDLKSE